MCLVHVCNTFIFTFKDCLFETYADVVVPGTQRVSAHLKHAVGSKEVQVPKDKDRVEGKFSLSPPPPLPLPLPLSLPLAPLSLSLSPSPPLSLSPSPSPSCTRECFAFFLPPPSRICSSPPLKFCHYLFALSPAA